MKTREIKILEDIDIGKAGEVVTTTLKGAEHFVSIGVAEYTTTPLKEVAKQYYEQGNNIVVLNSKKEPLVKWTKWGKKHQTLEEFEKLPWSNAEAYAIICGRKLKNGFYVGAIDVDRKKITKEALGRGKKLERLLRITQTEKTVNKGKHFIYYSQTPVKSMNNAHDYCGCEVLGEKRLCIMAPSKGYKRLNDNDPTEIKCLTKLFNGVLTKVGYKTISKKTKQPQKPKVPEKRELRPCVMRLLKRKHLKHLEKVYVVAEYSNVGYPQAEIEQIFREHRAWEGDNYNEEKTLYQINHIFNQNYKFYCAVFENRGLCEEVCKLHKNINDFLNTTGSFNAVLFAKHLMEKYSFKTTRDNKTLFVFNGAKGIYGNSGKTFIHEQLVKELDEATRERHLKDVLFFIEGSTYIDRIHNPLGQIAVENGILNVTTHELHPHTSTLFITSRLPIKYDPKANCPRIKKFIKEIVGNQEKIIQEVFGYCLWKAQPLHKTIMLVGEGLNGKSTLLNLLEVFLGSENVSNITLQELCYNRFKRALLYGKLANISADLTEKPLKYTGFFKMITGDDVVTAEEKFKAPFKFKNYAKLIFSANKIPMTEDDTIAFFRRWIIIACNNVFTRDKCNPNILKEITTKKEMSGLLNYALEGLQRLLTNGHFSIIEDISKLRVEYIRKSNSAKAFIEECLEHEPEPKPYITVVKLYELYVKYCKHNNLPIMQKRNITENMAQIIPEARKTTQKIKPKGADKSKPTKVWRFVKFQKNYQQTLEKVTKVTSYNSNRKINIKKSIVSVTDKGIKNNVKSILNNKSVTSVTFFKSCELCHGKLPDNLEHCVKHEGKYVHDVCFSKLSEGRRN